jgi:hypothetical protein
MSVSTRGEGINIGNERKVKQARTWKKKYDKLESYLSERNRKRKPAETKEENDNDNDAATNK